MAPTLDGDALIAAYRRHGLHGVVKHLGLADSPLGLSTKSFSKIDQLDDGDELVRKLQLAIDLASGGQQCPPLVGLLIAHEVLTRLPDLSRWSRRTAALLTSLQNLLPGLETSVPEDIAFQARLEPLCGRALRSHNEVAFVEGVTRLLTVMSVEQERWRVWHLHLRWFLALRGRGREFPRDPPEDPEKRGELRTVAFIDAVEAGRVDEAAALLTSLHAEKEIPQRFAHLVLWYEAYLLVMRMILAGQMPRRDLVESALPEGLDVSMRRSVQDFVWIATGEVHPMVHSMEGVILSSATVNSFHPLRIALGMRDLPLAAHLLTKRRTLGAQHWLDDLFRARLRLLEGDDDGARHAYAAAVTGARIADAIGRLEVELRLAHELGRIDLIRLGGGNIAPPVPPALAGEDGLDRQFVGTSPAAAQVRALIRRFAPSPLPVLLVGETGSGKEVTARALHQRSNRRNRPFIAVNCTTINDTVLESELFGHVRGAFSGADRDRVGLVTAAGDGTLFLDEVGDATPRFQAALLRLLDGGDYRLVGAVATRTAACRVIAATNVDLERAVNEGRFRRDLYHRLRRHEIILPSLADRQEDVVPLATAFLNLEPTGPRRILSPDLASYLRQRPWTGNVRELRNAMDNLLVLFPDCTTYTTREYAQVDLRRSVESKNHADEQPKTALSATSMDGSTLRRSERAAAIFAEHRRLTRQEFARLLDISLGTATTYLKRLCSQGVIRKVEPTGAPVSHYFERVD